MTNTLALWLVILIVGFFVLDHYVFHLEAGLFIARRGLALLEWMAFWR